MRKYLLVASLLFLCGSVFSQIYTPVVPTTYGVHQNRFKADSAQHVPEKDSLYKNTTDTTAQLFINRQDSALWGWTKARGFFPLEGSNGMQYSDTATMLDPYLRTNGDLPPLFTTTETSHNVDYVLSSVSAYQVYRRNSGTGVPSFGTLDSNHISGFSTYVRPLFSAAGTLSYDNVTGIFTGIGEVNTASNLGGGLDNFSVKVGSDLRFNSFLATDFNLGSNLISIDYTNGQAASGSTKGFLTSADWTTFNNKQPAGNYITALTGDGTASGPGSVALTLATVNSNIGTFNNVTVNAKGLVTSASNVSYLTGNQSITLSGDVTGSGTTAITTTIAADAVTNAKLADMAAHTFKGNNTGSTSNPIDLTIAQATAELDLFTSSLRGLVPGSGGGSTNYLRADGTWTVPPGTGTTETASNGLSKVGNDIRLGGSALSANSGIYTSVYSLDITSSSGSRTLGVYQTEENGYAIDVQSDQYYGINISGYGGVVAENLSGPGIFTSTTGSSTSVSGSSNSGIGGAFGSTSGVGLRGIVTPTSTNTVVPIQEAIRSSTVLGSVADGIGGSFDFNLATTGIGWQRSNQLISKWTTAANATRTSQFIITGVNSATTADLFTLSGSGAARLNKYGINTFAGTAAYALGVDASGNLVEFTGAAGGVNWNSIANPTGSQSLTFDDGEVNTWTVNSDAETFHTITANSITTGTVATIQSSSLTQGVLLRLLSTSTAASGNLERNLLVNTSGANANSTQTTYGASFNNTHTGTSSTNIAAEFTASGGTNNYAIIVPASSGRVGFGTPTPTEALDIVGNLKFSGAIMPNNLPGSAGEVLTSQGAGASPTWTTPSGSGANTALSNLASVAINAALVLGTSDAFALGSTTKQWSDLFLAEGGVINWDNGDATLTQVGDVVTLAGADLKVTTPGNVSTSVITTDATQTLTNKTLTSPTLTTPALGTPASGVVTNLTGTASININGTVGATTPAAGTFTTATANSFIPNLSTIPTNGMYLPAANNLGWGINSAAELSLTSTALTPGADGGNSLGTTSLGWQNLFGNTGFVWNIENGDWVATHTTGILTVGTGDLRVTTAGTNSASVVTVGGTQTLTNKTMTSPVINTPTGIVKGDVGLGNVDNTSNATERAATATLTNKRITKRTGTTASSGTPTINTDNIDVYTITALAANITSFTTNLSGTPVLGDVLTVYIKDDGTSRTIAWGASFENGAVTLPTATTISTTLVVTFLRNIGNTAWMAMAKSY